MAAIARLLLIVGLALILLGGILFLFSRFDIPLGRLPGDVRIERNNMTCIIGIGTSIFLSIVLTILLNLVVRLLNR